MFQKIRIKSLLFLTLTFGFMCSCNAQKNFKVVFDHDALLVSDIAKSADFYKNVLFLKEIPSPIENVDRKWFSLGGHYQLHLIKEDRPIKQNDVAMHYSVNVDDLDAYVKFLDKKGIPYTNWPTTKKEMSVRPDNVRQVYIQDPDGYWIEVNDATYSE